jgi:putative toxin-antitoxin system antitoxin component (TIGR02293 family)
MSKIRKNSETHSSKGLDKNKGILETTSSSDSMVSEPGVAYATRPGGLVPIRGQQPVSKKVNSLLITSSGTAENQMTSFEKMNIVQSGLTKIDLESLKAKTKLDYGNLAKALSVTRATLINKKKQQKFSPILSERIMSLADIYSYGYEVFEDEDLFNQWMFRPNQALNGRLPYDFMDNQFGREEVRNIIGRIDYGVYS